jgi:putative transposase
MEKQNRYSKAKWAKQLGVSASGYYVWLQTRSARQERYEICKGRVISAFKEGNGTYGTERVCGVIRRDGHAISYPVVKRIMAQEGLKSCHLRRRQLSLTDSRNAHSDEYQNLTKGFDQRT